MTFQQQQQQQQQQNQHWTQTKKKFAWEEKKWLCLVDPETGLQNWARTPDSHEDPEIQPVIQTLINNQG